MYRKVVREQRSGEKFSMQIELVEEKTASRVSARGNSSLVLVKGLCNGTKKFVIA